MKKTVRNVRMAKGEGRDYRERDLTDLWKLGAKLNLAACDLHGAGPFLPAESVALTTCSPGAGAMSFSFLFGKTNRELTRFSIRNREFRRIRRIRLMSNATGQPMKAAFEVTKGTRKVMTLSEAEVEKYLDPEELLDGLEDGFRALELEEVQAPPRPELSIPSKGFSLTMPAWRPGMQITVKIVNVFEHNLDFGLPNHLAVINLFDAQTGALSCVMDGTHVTGIRTAASAVLAARMLSRSGSRIATVIGAGVQGREHLRLLPLIRDLKFINICSLHMGDAQKLAGRSKIARATADVEAAVRESDIVCLATHSPEPVIRSEWVKPGAHVSSVGFHPPDGELPKDLTRKHRMFVETLDAFQPVPVGCSELDGLEVSKGTTLGAVALGRKAGRLNEDEITVYKAMGVAMEDMVAANLAYEKARRDGGGGVMNW